MYALRALDSRMFNDHDIPEFNLVDNTYVHSVTVNCHKYPDHSYMSTIPS